MRSSTIPQNLVSLFSGAVSLTGEEQAAVAGIPVRLVLLAADENISREGDRPSRCAFIADGLAASSKVVGDGKRQIIALHVAGDMPDLASLHLNVLDCDLRTVTECTVGFVDHAALRELCERHHKLAWLLWKETLTDAAIFREWVVNVGQRAALPRLAHLFCEMMARMEAVGLGDGLSCALPVTQGELGDMLGLSTVHVNRTLQELRSQNLVAFSGGRLTIHDWERLAQIGDFRVDYLHLEPSRPRPGGLRN